MNATADLIEKDLIAEGFGGQHLKAAKEAILRLIIKRQEMGESFFSKYEPTGVMKRLIMKYGGKKK